MNRMKINQSVGYVFPEFHDGTRKVLMITIEGRTFIRSKVYKLEGLNKGLKLKAEADRIKKHYEKVMKDSEQAKRFILSGLRKEKELMGIPMTEINRNRLTPYEEGEPIQDIEDFEFNKKEDDLIDENTNSFETFGEAINQFEKETGKSIFKKEIREGLKNSNGNDVVVTTVCSNCGDSLDMTLDSELAHIPFEGTRSCKCGNLIKTKWNGKELKYL